MEEKTKLNDMIKEVIEENPDVFFGDMNKVPSTEVLKQISKIIELEEREKRRKRMIFCGAVAVAAIAVGSVYWKSRK